MLHGASARMQISQFDDKGKRENPFPRCQKFHKCRNIIEGREIETSNQKELLLIVQEYQVG